MEKKITFKIQNLILRSDQLSDEHSDMLYRGSRFRYYPMQSAFKLIKTEFVEFFTYFNSFSYAKWKKYTCVDNVYLKLKCKGQFTVQMFGHFREGREIKKEFYPIQHYNLKSFTEFQIPVPQNVNGQVIGFQIQALSEFWIEGGGWYTEVPQSKINHVRISIATTTFKKEEYIKRNIGILERELFYGSEPCREHFRLIVVDNGRTLDPDEFNSEYVTVLPNDNVGGAGGYTRGMLESLRSDFKATHVLLMDDDVLVTAESFLRLYSLLALVKGEYKDRFVSGAMLYYEQMNMQHEDVGYVHKDGSYGPNKPIMDMNNWRNVFVNEEDVPFNENSYAGWWYCCIPVSKIDIEHLPVPLFIRGDDVEFSVSRKAEFLTLSGICIWHKGFVNKFNAALELYLVHRNSLIIQAMSGVAANVDFIKRIDKFFKTNLMRLAYNNCELLLDAIEDYLNGPEFMLTPQGERIMKEKGAKNEVLTPLHQLYDKLDEEIDEKEIFEDFYKDKKLNPFQSFWYNLTYNGHVMPKFLLKDKTGVIPYDWFYSPRKQYMCKQVLAVSESGMGRIRERSRRKFLELMKRRKKLLKKYKRNSKAVFLQYQKMANTLQSEGFWRDYLKM